VANFFKQRRWCCASFGADEPITDAFVANIHHDVAAHDLDVVHLRKGRRKGRHRPGVPGRGGRGGRLRGRGAARAGAVRGRAQEKTWV